MVMREGRSGAKSDLRWKSNRAKRQLREDVRRRNESPGREAICNVICSRLRCNGLISAFCVDLSFHLSSPLPYF